MAVLNISANKFSNLPDILQNLVNLKSLIAYKNKIEILSPILLNSLTNIRTLNLNHNRLKCIPAEIGRLKNLESLSVEHNQLEELPFELCYIEQLQKLYLGYNRLVSLPEEFGKLWRLKHLILHKNRLQELPASIIDCTSLTILDVACNELRTFPPEFECLPLQSFHYECNPLLELKPVDSVQEEEVFALKEIVARFIMNEIKNDDPKVWQNIIASPEMRTILNEGSQCALCGGFLLNTWLECVKFVTTQKGFKLSSSSSASTLMPINARLCSYKCFRKKHNFYGIAHSTNPQ